MKASASSLLPSERRSLRWASNAEAFHRVGRGSISDLRNHGAGPVEIVPSRAGPPTLRYKNEFLHSPFHPLLEAKGLAQTAVESASDLVLVLGLGLGYHVRDLLDRTTARIIVYEPDRMLLAGLMGRIDYGNLFISGRMVFVHDEEHLVEAMEASLRIGVRVSWLVLPGYARAFAEIVGRIQKRAWFRLSMFRRQVEMPVTESRRILLRSLENLAWLWKGRWARPKPDRQVWLNAVVLNAGCAGRIPGDVMRAIEERTLVAATSGAASGFRPHLSFGEHGVVEETLPVLPLDADPSAFKGFGKRPVVYTRVHDEVGQWAAGLLLGGLAGDHLPLGLSSPVDAALLCGMWFDRTFWIDLAPDHTSDPSVYDRVADRRYLAEMSAGFRKGGGFKLVLGEPGDAEIDRSTWITVNELRAEIDALPAESEGIGGDLAEKFLADDPMNREALSRLFDALTAEKRALNDFSARLGSLLERWGTLGHAALEGEETSVHEERRLSLESHVSDWADLAAPSRLISTLLKHLVLQVLRPWNGARPDPARLSRQFQSGQVFLVGLVRDIPLLGRLMERALYELQKHIAGQ